MNKIKKIFRRLLLMFTSVLPNPFKILIYSVFFGAKIGQGTKIGFGTVIDSDNIDLGRQVNIGRFTHIHSDSVLIKDFSIVGNYTTISLAKLIISFRCRVDHNVMITGGGSHMGGYGIFRMGMCSWVFPHCHINTDRPVILGKNVGVGGGSYIFTHGYWLPQIEGFPVTYGEVKLDDDVWLPWGCFIMPNVKIGKRVIVGARSLVNKSVPDHQLIAGAPAKIIRDQSWTTLDQSEQIELLKQYIREYSILKNITLTMSESNTKLIFKNNEKFIFQIIKNSESNDIESDLNIYLNCTNAVIENAKTPSFSVATRLSSKSDNLSKTALEFFVFARRYGVRFYPFDELSIDDTL
jgi:acetyltransferase-like isoleucine patch superfamily enzyme